MFHICSEFSVQTLSVWQLKVIVNTSPFWTVVFARLYLNDEIPASIAWTLIPIVIGPIISVIPIEDGKKTFDIMGTLLAIGAAITYSGNKIAAKHVFNQLTMDPVLFVFQTNILCITLLLPFWLMIDVASSSRDLLFNSETAKLIVLNGVLDACVAFSLLYFLHFVSATTQQIASVASSAIGMIVSIVWFHNVMNYMQATGLCITIIGMIAYSILNSNAQHLLSSYEHASVLPSSHDELADITEQQEHEEQQHREQEQ
jgi:drug/metabolite transporter (DMT)-like permease